MGMTRLLLAESEVLRPVKNSQDGPRRSPLLCEEHQYHGQQDADNDARHDGKVEAESVFLYSNVARQPAEERNTDLRYDDDSDKDEDDACQDKNFSNKRGHFRGHLRTYRSTFRQRWPCLKTSLLFPQELKNQFSRPSSDVEINEHDLLPRTED
jgi:hypothetical protein